VAGIVYIFVTLLSIDGTSKKDTNDSSEIYIFFNDIDGSNNRQKIISFHPNSTRKLAIGVWTFVVGQIKCTLHVLSNVLSSVCKKDHATGKSYLEHAHV
jgi:hypothetical protein